MHLIEKRSYHCLRLNASFGSHPTLNIMFYQHRIVCETLLSELAALAQMVACLPLVQQVRGSIPGGVVNFNLNIFYLGARRGGDVHFLIARLYITVLD